MTIRPIRIADFVLLKEEIAEKQFLVPLYYVRAYITRTDPLSIILTSVTSVNRDVSCNITDIYRWIENKSLLLFLRLQLIPASRHGGEGEAGGGERLKRVWINGSCNHK